MNIIPAILTDSASDVLFQIESLSPIYSRFQIDIADGLYVPNKTVPTNEVLRSIKAQSYSRFTPFLFDFHLMVRQYEQDLKKLDEAASSIRIGTVFIHAPALNDYGRLVRLYKNFIIGIAINPDDDIRHIEEQIKLNDVKAFLVMSVVPGFQGSPFVKESLNNIDYLRVNDYSHEIFVDGSVNDKTLPVIMAQKNRPNYICVGSFLSKSKNIAKQDDILKRIIQER